MKKLLVSIFVFAFALTSSFAEFVMSPSFGYANIYSQFRDGAGTYVGGIKTKSQLNHNALALGFDLGGYFRNGFSLFFNTNFAFAGNIKYSSSTKFTLNTGLGSVEKQVDINFKLKELSGVSWTSQLLLGGTKRFTDEFHLSFFTGLSIGIDSFRWKKIEKGGNSLDLGGISIKEDSRRFVYYTVGIPLQMNVAYYFAKHIGIVFSILDIPSLTIGSPDHFIEVPGGGVNKSSSYKMDFQNMFYIKIGPSFKF